MSCRCCDFNASVQLFWWTDLLTVPLFIFRSWVDGGSWIRGGSRIVSPLTVHTAVLNTIGLATPLHRVIDDVYKPCPNDSSRLFLCFFWCGLSGSGHDLGPVWVTSSVSACDVLAIAGLVACDVILLCLRNYFVWRGPMRADRADKRLEKLSSSIQVRPTTLLSYHGHTRWTLTLDHDQVEVKDQRSVPVAGTCNAPWFICWFLR